MKLLVLKAKYGDVIVCARNPLEEAKAWLYLFRQLDADSYSAYGYNLEGDEVEAYALAKEGSATGAKWLLSIRSDRGCGNEGIEFKDAEVPE